MREKLEKEMREMRKIIKRQKSKIKKFNKQLNY